MPFLHFIIPILLNDDWLMKHRRHKRLNVVNRIALHMPICVRENTVTDMIMNIHRATTYYRFVATTCRHTHFRSLLSVPYHLAKYSNATRFLSPTTNSSPSALQWLRSANNHCHNSPFIFLNLLCHGHPMLGRLVYIVVGLDQHFGRHCTERLQEPPILRGLLNELKGPLGSLELGHGEVKLAIIVGEGWKQ